MAESELRCQRMIAKPLHKVFRVFEGLSNLASITPGWQHFQVQNAANLTVGCGLRVHYTICWLGFPLRWCPHCR